MKILPALLFTIASGFAVPAGAAAAGAASPEAPARSAADPNPAADDKPASRFCPGLEIFTTRTCPGTAIAAAYKARSGRGKKFLDSAREGDVEALLFARQTEVYLLIRAGGIREIRIPNGFYRESMEADVVVPLLGRLMPIDRAGTALLFEIDNRFYEGNREDYFYLPGRAGSRPIRLVGLENTVQTFKHPRGDAFTLTAKWSNEGFPAAIIVDPGVRLRDPACKQIIDRVDARGHAGPLPANAGELQDSSLVLRFRLTPRTELLKCEGSTVPQKPG